MFFPHAMTLFLVLMIPASLSSVWREMNTDFRSPNQAVRFSSGTHAEDVLTATEDPASSVFSSVSSGVTNAAEKTKNFVTTTYSNVATEVSDAAEDAGNFFTSSWDAVSSFSSNAATGVQDFFVSGYRKVATWWSELEEEAKEFFHLIMKVVDILLGVVIFVIFLWVIYKVRQTYNFVERHITPTQGHTE